MFYSLEISQIQEMKTERRDGMREERERKQGENESNRDLPSVVETLWPLVRTQLYY